MIETKLLTFDEVMTKTLKEKRYLLLGNGFSMAYEYERFSFTSLLQSAVDNKIIEKDTPIYNLFNEFGTSDFEMIIKLLESSSIVLKYYDDIDPSAQEKMNMDAIALKKHLVSIVTNNHPEKANKVSDEEYLSCIELIKRFDTIFTLNYDLLLFWTTMKFMELDEEGTFISDKERRLKVSDGFGSNGIDDDNDYVIFKNDNSNFYQTIHYLHGALHIFDKKHEIIKNTYKRTQKALKDQTIENLNKSIYPVFISEGTTNQKKAKIIHNPYLNNSYKTLKTIPSYQWNKPLSKNIHNSLIIFGTMLKSNDEHIIDAIINSKVQNIYVGISSLEKISEFSYFEARLDGKRQLHFYDYNTLDVWREK